jgi:hypothetical protein
MWVILKILPSLGSGVGGGTDKVVLIRARHKIINTKMDLVIEVLSEWW